MDIVPVFNTGCTDGQNAVNAGSVAYTYTIDVRINIDNISTPPTVFASFSAVCPGDGRIALIGSTPNTGTTVYNWTGPNGFTATGANAFTNDPADEGIYTLIVTVDGCDSDPEDVQVDYLTFAPVVAAVDNNVCFGEAIQLEVTGAGTNFDWFDPDGNPVGTNASTLTTTAAGTGGVQTYSVRASDGTCSEDLTIDITVSDEITGDIIVRGICAGEPTSFTAQMTDGSPFPAGWAFDWDSGSGTGDSYQITENTPGDYTVEVTLTNLSSGCTSSLSEPYTIAELPSVSIDPVDPTICSDGNIVLTANASGGSGNYDYIWNLDPAETGSTLTIDANSAVTNGIFVDIADDNGCLASSTMVDVTILPNLPGVTFGACGTGSETEVTFSWDDVGQTAFEIYLTVAGMAEQTISLNYLSLSYTATGLTPGTSVTLRVVPFSITNGAFCFGPEQSQTCSTDNASCDNPGWLFTAIDPICLTVDGQAFDLTINTTATGTIVLNSTDLGLTNQPNGPGGVTPVSLPALPGGTSSDIYTVTASFRLPGGTCPFDTTFSIPVVTPADPEISRPFASICSAQETVRFTLVNAYDPNANYTISVDDPSGTSIVLEDAPNQVFDITFSEYRTYQITVTTTTLGNNTCSDSFTIPFTLVEPPAPPTLICAGTGLDSIAFSWSDVGADSYFVDEISIPAGGVVERNGNTFIVRNLMAGDSVTISVTASSANCLSATSMPVTCFAQTCPAIVPQITTPVDTFCADGSASLVDLTADVPSAGTVVWSGPGVVGTQFDPGAAGAGAHGITVEYTEGNCDYSATFELVVVDPPSGMINIVSDTICQGETSNIVFSGTNPNNANFEWIFPAGATVVNGDVNGPGPLEVSFSGLGDQVAQLVLTGAFCEIDTLRNTVFVATPIAAVVLECVDVDFDQVGFSWSHPTATDFIVVVLDSPAGATINQMNNSLLATGLAEGESVSIRVTPISNNACPNGLPQARTCTAASCPVISFSIDPLGPICFGDNVAVPLTTSLNGSDGSGVLTFADSTFNTGGNFNPSGLAPGIYTVTAVFEEGGCPFPASVDIEVTDLPDPSFTLPAGPVCIDEVVGADAGAAQVGWSYVWIVSDVAATVVETSPTTRDISWSTPGMKDVTLIVRDENGCENRSTETIEIQAPRAAPVIGCVNTTFTSLEFNWNTEAGVDSFMVTVNGGASFFQDSTNLFLDGLNEAETVNIQVVALSSGACGNSLPGMRSCETDTCPIITVTPPNNQSFCLGAMGNTVPLIATQIGAGGSGAFTFSGPGVTENAGTYSFDADAAGSGVHTIMVVYDESVCSGTATFEFTVNTIPTSDFTLNGLASDLTVCEGEDFVLAYSGDLPQASNGTFNWDFAPAMGGSDGGYESYNLNYAAEGEYTISLSVENDGCESETTLLNVSVEAPFAVPVISCDNSSFNSVEFNWNAEAGVDSFMVTVNGGASFFQDSTNLFLDGLNEAETVNIQVVALSSGACGNSLPGMGSCETDTCPIITVTPPNNQSFCLGAMGNTIPLIATQIGAGGSGAFTFSGPGVTENAGTYSFDADAAGSGVHTIMVVYDESVCSGTATFEFTVNRIPTSDFTLNGLASDLTVCEGEDFVLAYSGDLPQASNGTFNWDFAPAMGGSDGGYESFSLNYATEGEYTISLSVENDGCESEMSLLVVTVEAAPLAPVVDCIDATQNSVTFGWSPVPGAEGYLTSDGIMLGAGDLSYTVSGLMASESVTLTVMALSSCGNSLASVVVECTSLAEDCATGETIAVACNDNDPCTDNDMITVLRSDQSIVCIPCAGIPQDCQNSTPVSMPCNDGNNATINDEQTVLCDGTICEPCAGVPCDFSISLETDRTISIGDSLSLRLVSNGTVDSVVWEDLPGLSCLNCLEPIAKPTMTIAYSVTAFDGNGCESEGEITIIVDERRKIYIPNVFSPNGDGINDFFEVQGGPDIRAIRRLTIYDRWGSEFFDIVDQPINSPDARWQGDRLGQAAEVGVYVYVALVEFTDGHVEQVSGEFLLMK